MVVINDWLSKNGFKFFENLDNAILYVNGDIAVIIDNTNICDIAFSYNKYTKEQNDIMFKYSGCYRFFVDNENDFEEMKSDYKMFLSNDFSENEISFRGSNRELQSIDPSNNEVFFENIFEEVYGREAIGYVKREYPVLDVKNATRFIDYVIFKENYFIAIEENGVSFHNPCNITKKQYKSQLCKQNSIVSQNGKIYRWSTEDIKFHDVVADEMRQYFGEKEEFINMNLVKLHREVTLYKHQKNWLKTLERDRENGKKSFLVVLPPGTGKSRIILEDIERIKIDKGLIICPTRKIRDQWRKDLVKYENKFIIETYSWISRHFRDYDKLSFSYFIVDEAHHSPAPTIRKVIQYFDTNCLIGLTATPDRLDGKKVSKIFGEYESLMTLEDAIKDNILCNIRAYRLKSSIDLSEVRFNGKDYTSSDLEKRIRVTSRNQLIVDLLKKTFVESSLNRKSGVIFCVNIKHVNEMTRLMKEQGFSVAGISSKHKNSEKDIENYKKGSIQFLCVCDLLNEGWDSPRTSIIVMARPTMSKVLYTQQLGRGTRKFSRKEALYVIDVVDNYNSFNMPWSLNGLFGRNFYSPWASIVEEENIIYSTDNEFQIISNLFENEMKIEKINIFTFEELYGDYLSEEQLARELFINTGTLRSWIKKGEVIPNQTIPFGRRKLNYFKPEAVEIIIREKDLKFHNEETIYEDFKEYIDEGSYSFSYKIIFILSVLKVIDKSGEAKMNEILDIYINYYIERHNKNYIVEKRNSPYSRMDYLEDRKSMEQSMIQNPFEKFERKRFIYYSKDLSKIAFNHILWRDLNNDDIKELKNKMIVDLNNYYEDNSLTEFFNE